MASLAVVDAIWERWDLVCDPGGCEPLDQLLRAMVYGFVLIGWMIFYAAIRPWTRNLPVAAGVTLAAVSAALIVWFASNIVVSSPRAVAVVVGLGLVAVWVGRPAFTERSNGNATPEGVSEDASPTSSTH